MPAKRLVLMASLFQACFAFGMADLEREIFLYLRDSHQELKRNLPDKIDEIIINGLSWSNHPEKLRQKILYLRPARKALTEVAEQVEKYLALLEEPKNSKVDLYFYYGAASIYSDIFSELMRKHERTLIREENERRYQTSYRTLEKKQIYFKNKLDHDLFYELWRDVDKRRYTEFQNRKKTKEEEDLKRLEDERKFVQNYHRFSNDDVEKQYLAAKTFIDRYQKIKANMTNPSVEALDEHWENLRFLWYSYKEFRAKFKIDHEKDLLLFNRKNPAESTDFHTDSRFRQVIEFMQEKSRIEPTFLNIVSQYFTGKNEATMAQIVNDAIWAVEGNEDARGFSRIVNQESSLAKSIADQAKKLVEVYDRYPKVAIPSYEQNKELLDSYLEYADAVQTLVHRIDWGGYHQYFHVLKELGNPDKDSGPIHLSAFENAENEERIARLLVYSRSPTFSLPTDDGFPKVNAPAVISLLNATRAVESGGFTIYRNLTFLGECVTKPTNHVGTHALTLFETPFRGLGARILTKK